MIVLIAEDDEDDFLFFSLAVLETNVPVALKRVVNGKLLMNELDQKIPDLLFLDLQMPLKDGRECLKEIRLNANCGDLPIIMFTSYTDLRSIEYCYSQGANVYMIKPNRLRRLTEMLNAVFYTDWPRPLNLPNRSDFVIPEQTRD